MLRRGRETACRALIGCAAVALLGCKADTEPGRNPLTRTPPLIDGPVNGMPLAGSSAGTTALPVGGTTGTGGGQAGAPVPAGSSSMAGGSPGVPMVDRVFDAGDPSLNRVQAGQVCRRLAQIQCAGEAYCCDNPGRDVAACEVTMTDGCANGLYLDQVTLNPKTGFDADRAATAFQELERLASTCDTSIGRFGLSGTGLMSMLRGTVAVGGTCDPGLTTEEAEGAAALASCQGVETISCLPRSMLSWKCEVRGSVGGMCFTDLNCQEGLYCPNPNLAFGQTMCTQRKAEGQPCAAANECASLSCRGGSCQPESVQALYCLME